MLKPTGPAIQQTAADVTPPTASSVRWALVGLSVAMLLPSLGVSIANVALPTLAVSFGATFQQVQWVVLAYLLATTTLVVSAGRLGDLLGRRRLLVSGISLFAAASVACAVAPSLGWLIAGRVAQGAGAAVMMSLTIAFVGHTVPKSRTGWAMGLLGTMSAVGTALGPSLGGLLIAGLGWPAIFALNLPLAIVAVFLARRYLPADRPGDAAGRPGFDVAGTVVLASTLAAYALAMTIGRGAFGYVNIALLGAALLGTGLFLIVEARASSPLVHPALFRDRALRAGLATSALVSTVIMTNLVVGPFYLARGLHLGTAAVGLVLSIAPIAAALAGAPAGRLVDRMGAQRVALGGLAGMAVGCVALSVLPTGWGVFGYIGSLVIVTTSYSTFQAANNTAVMAEASQEQRGLTSGLLTLSRNLGLITGASVMGAIFAGASGVVDVATAVPDAIATGMRVTFAVAALLVLVALVIAIARRNFGKQ